MAHLAERRVSLNQLGFESSSTVFGLYFTSPGSSSLVGLMTENGPLQVTGNYSIVENEFSWNKLADAFWVDQPGQLNQWCLAMILYFLNSWHRILDIRCCWLRYLAFLKTISRLTNHFSVDGEDQLGQDFVCINFFFPILAQCFKSGRIPLKSRQSLPESCHSAVLSHRRESCWNIHRESYILSTSS